MPVEGSSIACVEFNYSFVEIHSYESSVMRDSNRESTLQRFVNFKRFMNLQGFMNLIKNHESSRIHKSQKLHESSGIHE